MTSARVTGLYIYANISRLRKEVSELFQAIGELEEADMMVAREAVRNLYNEKKAELDNLEKTAFQIILGG